MKRTPFKRKPTLKRLRPLPKRRKLATAAEREHLARVKALPCVACGYCGMSNDAHHIRDGKGMGQKASHCETVALCRFCHRVEYGGQRSFPGARETFEVKHGTERELLSRTLAALDERGWLQDEIKKQLEAKGLWPIAKDK